MMTKDERRTTKDLPVSSLALRHSSDNKTRPARPRTRSALAVPPWFAGTSRPRPQRSTPTQPRNGRRRPGPTSNSAGESKPALPPVGLSPAAPECPSEGAQAAFAAIAALWTAPSASYSLHQRFWQMFECAGGYHGACEVSRQIFGRFKYHRPAIRHRLDAELRAWSIANTYA